MLKQLNIYVSRDIPIDRIKKWTKQLKDYGANVSDLRKRGMYTFIDEPGQMFMENRGQAFISEDYLRALACKRYDLDVAQRAANWEEARAAFSGGNDAASGVLQVAPSLLSHRLRGVVVFCAGMKSQTVLQVARLVIDLGGKCAPQLDDSVTHVIVQLDKTGITTFEAFRWAHRHSVPVVSPEWLVKSRRQFNLNLPFDNYRVKPLNCIGVSITGVSKAVRPHIKHIVELLGGKYYSALERECTHLIASGASSDKVKWAINQWKQPVVSLRWLLDCLRERAPVPMQRYLLCDPKTGALLPSAAAFDNEKEEAETMALSESLRASTTAARLGGAAGDAATIVVHSTTSTTTANGGGGGGGIGPVNVNVAPLPAEEPREAPALQGMAFVAAASFNKSQRRVLEERLAGLGARMVTTDDAGGGVPPTDALVIALHGSPEATALADGRSGLPPWRMVTPEWVVRSGEEGRPLPLDQSILFQPLPFEFPLAEAEHLVVTLSGFPGEVGRELSLRAELLGMRLNKDLTRSTTHLVCAAPNGAKWAAATKWAASADPGGLQPRCHIVSRAWLDQCIAQGRIVPVDDFPLAPAVVAEGLIARRSAVGAGQSMAPPPPPPPPSVSQTGGPIGDGGPGPVPPPPVALMLDDAGSDDSDDGGMSLSDAAAVQAGALNAAHRRPPPSGVAVTPLDRRRPAPAAAVAAVQQPPSSAAADNGNALEGVVVFAVVRGADRAIVASLHDAVAQLGGSYTTKPDRSVTHVVVVGTQTKGAQRAIAQALAASSPQAVAVSALWVRQCAALQDRLKEVDFPPAVDPRRCLPTTTVVAGTGDSVATNDEWGAPVAGGYQATAGDGVSPDAAGPPEAKPESGGIANDGGPLVARQSSQKRTSSPQSSDTAAVKKKLRYKTFHVKPEVPGASVKKGAHPASTADVTPKSLSKPSASNAGPARNLDQIESVLAKFQGAGRAERSGANAVPTDELRNANNIRRPRGALDNDKGNGETHDDQLHDDSEGTAADSFAAALRMAPLRMSGFGGGAGGDHLRVSMADGQSSAILGTSTASSQSQKRQRRKLSQNSKGATEPKRSDSGGGAGGGQSVAPGNNHRGSTRNNPSNDAAAVVAGRSDSVPQNIDEQHSAAMQNDDDSLVLQRKRSIAQARAQQEELVIAAAVAGGFGEASRRRSKRAREEPRGGGPGKGSVGLNDTDDGGADDLDLDRDGDVIVDDDDQDEDNDDTKDEAAVVGYGLHDEEMAKQAEVWRKVRAANNPDALRVAVTSVHDDDRAQLGRLKLQVQDTVRPGVTTHVVAGSCIKSEKFLLGCALGIWVLRPSFLHASKPGGQFPPCEEHEWNADHVINASDSPVKDSTKLWLAQAPRQNRVKRDAGKGLAFEGWCVMVFSATAKNKQALTNVLRAGGATVVDSIHEPDAQRLTHCLVSRTAIPDAVAKRLRELEVPVCSLDLFFYTLSRPARKPNLKDAKWRASPVQK